MKELSMDMSKIVVCAAALCATQVALGQNLLENPGFEDGLYGWTTFGNVYHEWDNPPQFVPYEGQGLVSMFGPFTGNYGASGLYQSFPAEPGSRWTMDVYSRHWSGDALFGDGEPFDNWVVQKIVFRNDIGEEIGGVPGTILDGTFDTDIWYDNDPIEAVAPAETVAVEAFLLFIQPEFDGGAAHVDSVYFASLGDDCPPDLNGDSLVNSQDFIIFLNAFTSGDPLADWNDDGVINSQDFIAFLNDFVGGC